MPNGGKLPVGTTPRGAASPPTALEKERDFAMNRLLLAATVAALAVGTAMAQGGKQTKCPVMNEALGDKPITVAYTGKTAAYKGKSIQVCCGGCVGAIKKDPDKFFKMVYAKK